MNEEFKEKIISLFMDLYPQKIVLFGSACRVPWDETGDVDLIIVYNSPKRFLERLKELYERWDLPKAVDILAYTPKEFDELMMENPFLQDAVERGILIYEAAS